MNKISPTISKSQKKPRNTGSLPGNYFIKSSSAHFFEFFSRKKPEMSFWFSDQRNHKRHKISPTKNSNLTKLLFFKKQSLFLKLVCFLLGRQVCLGIYTIKTVYNQQRHDIDCCYKTQLEKATHRVGGHQALSKLGGSEGEDGGLVGAKKKGTEGVQKGGRGQGSRRGGEERERFFSELSHQLSTCSLQMKAKENSESTQLARTVNWQKGHVYFLVFTG